MSLGTTLAAWLRPRPPSGSITADHRHLGRHRFGSAARSHVGCVRAINEDRVFACPERGLWAIADGMGGHAAGDIAAEAATVALQQLAREGRVEVDAVEEALRTVNRNLHRRVSEGAPMSGATIVVMVDMGDALTILWAGDCRAYRLRDGRLDPITRDHSVVQELIDAGAIDAVHAARHPHAHVVTRALGAAEIIALDRVTVAVAPGDLYLLCSDGLPEPCTHLARGLQQGSAGLDQMADLLLADALDRGGRDNISLVLVREDQVLQA